MRTILLALLMAGLVIALPVAAADNDDDDDDDDRAAKHAHREKHREDKELSKDEKAARRIAWHENRTARFDAAIAQMQAMRASWNENATAIREDCRKATPNADGPNATKHERHTYGRCLHEGYLDWRADHRSQMRDLRDTLRLLFGGWRAMH